MIVCSCRRVTLQQVERALDEGAATVDEVGRACGAGTGCGGCRNTLRALLDSDAVVCASHHDGAQPAMTGT